MQEPEPIRPADRPALDSAYDFVRPAYEMLGTTATWPLPARTTSAPAISEQVFGADHPNIAASLNNLGLLLQDQGDLAAARPYGERALDGSATSLWSQPIG